MKKIWWFLSGKCMKDGGYFFIGPAVLRQQAVIGYYIVCSECGDKHEVIPV